MIVGKRKGGTPGGHALKLKEKNHKEMATLFAQAGRNLNFSGFNSVQHTKDDKK